MSYYYDYYIGYRKKGEDEDIVYPLGPYDYQGKLKSVLCKSRSFASDLHEDFTRISNDKVTKELLNALEWEDTKGAIIKYLSVKDLGSSDFIKTGYFLIKDIETYYKYKDECSIGDLDIFYDKLTPELYALKMQNELAFNVQEAPITKDDEGYEVETHLCRDYAFFSYPDYSSKEYEIFVIKNALSVYDTYDYKTEDIEFVIIETEG